MTTRETSESSEQLENYIGRTPLDAEMTTASLSENKATGDSIDQTQNTCSEHPVRRASKDEHDFPEGGYGWICVVCQLLIAVNTSGLNGAFGVYLAHYVRTNFFPGTPSTTYAFIGGISLSQSAFVAPLVTYSVRTIGTRPTLAIGLLMETTSLVGASFSTKLWQLILSQGLLYGWGSGCQYIASVGIIPQWFSRRRSLAAAIAAAGSGLGGLIYSLAAIAIIKRLSVAWSFRITAAVAFVINAVCALLIRDRNREIDPNQKSFDLSLLKKYRFLLVLAWSEFFLLAYTIVLFSLPNNAVELGLSEWDAAVTGALVSLGQTIGRPIIGYFSDNIGRINMLLISTFLCSVWCLGLWTSANNYVTLLAFAILGGTAMGAFYAVIAPVVTECVDIANLPAALSIIWTLTVFPTLFGSPLALKLTSSSKPVYLPVEIFTGFMFFAATICALLLRIEMLRLRARRARRYPANHVNQIELDCWNLRFLGAWLRMIV